MDSHLHPYPVVMAAAALVVLDLDLLHLDLTKMTQTTLQRLFIIMAGELETMKKIRVERSQPLHRCYTIESNNCLIECTLMTLDLHWIVDTIPLTAIDVMMKVVLLATVVT